MAAALLSGTATAQGYTFQLDSGSTNFTWTGTSSLGDITELPPGFTLSGTAGIRMIGGGNPVGSGSFITGGSASVSPDLFGEIPDSMQGQPPLATIHLTGLQVEVLARSFNVAPDGSFNTSVTVNLLAGTRTITPAGGSPIVTDLAGESAAPAPATGTLTWNGSEYVAMLAVSTAFPFSESGTGITGSVDITGTLVARHAPEMPSVYCNSLPNSTGQTANISFSGQPSIGAGAPTIHSDFLPANTFGIYFHGPNQIDLPFGNGRRCVGGTLVRFAPVSTGATGQVTQLIDNSALPNPLMAGESTNFQFWFRDVPGGGAGFNTSDALAVTYTP